MDRFWDEFSKSTITSGLLAIAVWGAIIYLAAAQQPVPDVMAVGGGAIIGFFFGAKNKAQSGRIESQAQAMAIALAQAQLQLDDGEE